MDLFNTFLNLPRFFKQLIVLLVDILSASVALFLTLVIILEKVNINIFDYFFLFILSSLIFIPFFIPFGLYQAIFRYSGIFSIINIFISCLIYGTVFYIICFFSTKEQITISLGILQPIFFFILVSSSRVFIVLIYRLFIDKNFQNKAIIYGAGNSGVKLLRQLDHYNFQAFIDDDNKKHGKKIDNLKIYSTTDVDYLINNLNIKYVFIALPNISKIKRKKIIYLFENYSVGIKFFPKININISNKKSKLDENYDLTFSDLEVEDILDRDISWNNKKVKNEIENKKILITGSGGSIGSGLSRQIIYNNPKELIIFDNSEYNLYQINNQLNAILKNHGNETIITSVLGDICDNELVSNTFDMYKPDVVFHAAAYKHVPLLEDNIFYALKNNVFGTITLLENSINYNVKKFVFISTDKAVRPSNIMGATKRLSEIYLQSRSENVKDKIIISIVRFGNVFASKGSAVPLFLSQIKKGGPVTVTHQDITRYFMTIKEAVGLVLEANHLALGGEVFVLNMGQPIKIIDLAKKIIKISGYTEKNSSNPKGDINIEITGLRPGEKLYEELLIGNNPISTSNENIFKANEDFIKWNILKQIIKEFENAIVDRNKTKIISLLKSNVNLI